MRDVNRIYVIMNKLTALWSKNPDLRFYQLMHAITSEVFHDNPGWEDLFYLEDDKTLATLNRLTEEAL